MNNSLRFKIFISQFISLFIYPLLNANVLFPPILMFSLGGAAKLAAPLTIILGLLVEWFIIKKISKLSLKDSFVITLIMNIISSILGAILTAIIGAIIILFSIKVLHIGDLLRNTITNNETGLVLGLILSTIINIFIESKVFFWKYPTGFNRKTMLKGIALANILSGIIIAIWFLVIRVNF